MRIIIVDDHPLFRSGVRNLLATTDDMEIVAEGGTGEEAVQLAAQYAPDVMLMDIRMPGMNGIEATKLILAGQPGMHILILTMFKDDQSVFTALRAGARGYLLKDADEEELLQGIRVVAAGGAVFGADIAGRMMDYFAGRSHQEPEDEAYAALTLREKEILKLIAGNASNAEIAVKLHLSAKTVANYVSILLNKLQVPDRKEARRIARELQLGGDASE